MVDEIDIWRTANLIIQHHGEGAPLEAALRADQMIFKSDLDGEAVWKRVHQAVLDLLENKPPAPSN